MQDGSFAPVSKLLIDHARPEQGERIIDMGCGCGATAIELAARSARQGMCSASIFPDRCWRGPAIDAEERLAEFVLADATTYPFKPGAADLIVSRFGVMFFADPARSFANMRKALRKAGRLTFICWRSQRKIPG